MIRNILVLAAVICLMVAGRIEGEVTPRYPLPEGAIKIFETKEYTCEPSEAGYPSLKAAAKLEKNIVADYVDIKPYIRDYHLVQGFIDILLSVHMRKIEGVSLPTWYMPSDTGDNIGAYCDGVGYDLIDDDFKTTFSRDDIFTTRGVNDDYVVLRFGLPEKVEHYYEIFIDKGGVKLTTEAENPAEIYPRYTDGVQVRFYLAPPETKVYACCRLLDIPITYYDETGESIEPEKRVLLNIPITFDASGSIDISGKRIVQYEFDFDNNVNPGWDTTTPDPVVMHTYSTFGDKKVVVRATNEIRESSTTDGDVCVSKSNAPLPLWVKVVKPPVREKEIAKLYQCAPHPFISGQHSETRIKYIVYSSCQVKIKIYTFSGDLVKTLLNDEEKFPGEWVTTWDGTNEDGEKVGSGIYFCQMQAGESRAIKNIVLIK